MCKKNKKIIKKSVTNHPLKLLLIMKGGVHYEKSMQFNSYAYDVDKFL